MENKSMLHLVDKFLYMRILSFTILINIFMIGCVKYQSPNYNIEKRMHINEKKLSKGNNCATCN